MRTAVGMESSREVLSSALKQVTVPGYYLEFGFRGLQEPWSGDSFSFDLDGHL